MGQTSPRGLAAASAFLLLALPVSGCASLAGSPPRVIGVAESQALLRGYSISEALDAFEDKGPGERRGYRDLVVTLYRNAIDARFHDFRMRLSSEGRGISTGLDLLLAGYAAAATVATGSLVNNLAAASAGIVGARGAIDRNVYFDRALPGLFAAMDTQRLRVRTRIENNLRLSAEEYPLAAAFTDLSDYEMAGSLDRAVETLTTSAVEARQAAERELAAVTRTCRVQDDQTVVLTDRMMTFVRMLAADAPSADLAERRQDLQSVALLVGVQADVTVATNSHDLAALIGQRLVGGIGGRCAADEYEALLHSMETRTERTVP